MTERPQIQIFECGREDTRPYCQCDMRAVKYCVHELGGARKGERCGKPLCQRCATPQGRGREPGVCQAHAPEVVAWDPTQVPPRRS